MAAASTYEASAIHWSALFSWTVAAACLALAWRKRRRVESVAPPERSALLRELGIEPEVSNDDVSRQLAVTELNQRLGDVSFELDLMPIAFSAFIRICLASGSALALLGFLVSNEQPILIRAARFVLAASGGVFGAIGVAFLGRTAKARTRVIREKWDNSSRDIGKALRASLEANESKNRTR